MAQITKTTVSFLKELKKNNTREWFAGNKRRYEASQEEMIAFAEAVLGEMNKFDKIETVSGKKSLFRIYRDVRFSKNKDPYKVSRSGFFSRSGADRRGGYYFKIQPGDSMIGGGFYQPNKEDLLLIRQQIQQDSAPLKKVLENQAFKNYFGTMQGEQLKTAPKGFDKEEEEIELLRYKSHYFMHSFSDQEVVGKNFYKKVAEGFQKIIPFFDVMTEYLTTDLNGESLIEE